jgi:ATP/maltotriose-dependent transcriptional regulator MalT
MLQRTFSTIRNDPFIKLSLSLCVLVGSGTLVMELYKKWKKNAAPKVMMLPSGFAHYSVDQYSQVSRLQKKLQYLASSRKGALPLLYITGSPGSGKTELVRQFCNNSSVFKKWLGLKSVTPVVLCIDASSPELLQMSLLEAAEQFNVNPASNLEDLFSALLTELSSNKRPWFLVVDNLTRNTAALFEALLNTSNTNCHQGAVLVTTQLSPSENQATYEISRYVAY